MATVLTLGSVPPANPYRQPASHRLAALATTAPESRREDRRRIDGHHRELKSGPSPSRSLRELDPRVRGTRQCVERGPTARHHFPTPPPFGFQHRPPPPPAGPPPGGGDPRNTAAPPAPPPPHTPPPAPPPKPPRPP